MFSSILLQIVPYEAKVTNSGHILQIIISIITIHDADRNQADQLGEVV